MSKHSSRRLSLVAWIVGIVLLSFLNGTESNTLKQVHVIARHGARRNLEKDGDTLSEEQETGGPPLTPLGQKQLYDLGVWLRETYNKKEWLEFYNPALVRLESSDFDRTITSANSLSLGLFPLHTQASSSDVIWQNWLPESPSLPVYIQQRDNDIHLRSYRTCPRFLEKLETLYDSAPWKSLEHSNAFLLTGLSGQFPKEAEGGKVPLKGLWNVYDQIHVARTECKDASSFSCQSLENPTLATLLSDDEFEQLEKLMENSENMKFGPATASTLLGSRLLQKIISRATSSERFFLYSAHAPTILGLFSTLQETLPGERFVDYGSALICEIYQEDSGGELTMRWLYKPGSNTEVFELPLNAIDCAEVRMGDDQKCIFSKFSLWAKDKTLSDEAKWCRECRNEMSDVCLLKLVEDRGRLAKIAAELEARLAERESNDPLVIWLTVLGAFAGGLFVMGVSCLVCCKNTSSKQGMELVGLETEENDTPQDQLTPLEMNNNELT